MDAAIERIARERGLARVDPVYPLALPSAPPRLRWKGIEVSEEFRRYAERVARGEDLPPFAGRVLAEPHADFPWDGALGGKPASSGGGARLALGACAAAIVGVVGWSVAASLQAADSRNAALLAAPAFSAPAAGEEALSLSPSSARERDELGLAESRALASGGPGEAAHAGLRHRDLQPSVGHEGPTARAVSELELLESGQRVDALGGPHAAEPAAPAAPPLEPPAPAETSPRAPEAALPAPPAPEPPRPEPKASPSPEAELDFGIDPAAPAALRPATEVAPSVVDIMRASPPVGESVRKEPASESSAKGSLLVESPSF